MRTILICIPNTFKNLAQFLQPLLGTVFAQCKKRAIPKIIQKIYIPLFNYIFGSFSLYMFRIPVKVRIT